MPLIQHLMEYNSPHVNTTALRLIAIQSLPRNWRGILDAKVPVKRHNGNGVPATVGMELGEMLSPAFGVYVDGWLGGGRRSL